MSSLAWRRGIRLAYRHKLFFAADVGVRSTALGVLYLLSGKLAPSRTPARISHGVVRDV